MRARMRHLQADVRAQIAMSNHPPPPPLKSLHGTKPFIHSPNSEALFVALVLAPGTFPRNKFFELFKDQELMWARRRAQAIRSLVKELTEPWPHPGRRSSRSAPTLETAVEEDGMSRLTYSVDDLGYRRSALLTPLEAATLNYALSQAKHGIISDEERSLVEAALKRLSPA